MIDDRRGAGASRNDQPDWSVRIRRIEDALEQLPLSARQQRKISAILNALEVQLEDGDGSAEVRRLLLDALRAASRQVASDRQAAVILSTIDAFEQEEAPADAEAARPPLPSSPNPLEAQLAALVEQGYQQWQGQQKITCCDRWLEAWEVVKQLKPLAIRTAIAFDETYPARWGLLFTWCQDVEAALYEVGGDNPIYQEHRLRYAREFLEQFSDEGPSFQINFMRAQGQALWRLGRRPEAEEIYAKLVELLPDEAWAYISWADEYWLYPGAPKEYDRAEAILERGVARERLEDRLDLTERLEDLRKESGKAAPVSAASSPQ